MSIIKSHTRPKEERTSKSVYEDKRVKYKDYQYVEDLLALIIADVVNGIQRSDILTKLMEQLYEGQRQKYALKTAQMYYETALQRIREDREDDIEDLKAKLYSQYYQLYADAMQDGNTIVAKQVLDSIAKIFVGDTKNVNLNGKVDEKVTIDFSFS